MRWKNVAVIGVGLLGGSLGMALRKARLCHGVIGYVRRQASVAECERRGAVDTATTSVADAVRGADMIILCTPLAQMRSLVRQMLPHVKRGAVITDVGSVKGSVARELEALVAKNGAYFVGSHPMAGAEKTGVSAAREDLFRGAVCVITPTPQSSPKAVRQVRQLWRQLGCRLLMLSPGAHDLLVSRSSHLPHVLAAQLTHLVLDPQLPPEQKLLCANGFRDSTRIASGSPEMWRDIAMANRKNLSHNLGVFIRQLQKLRSAIAAGDAERVIRFFAAAKERRDAWVLRATGCSPE